MNGGFIDYTLSSSDADDRPSEKLLKFCEDQVNQDYFEVKKSNINISETLREEIKESCCSGTNGNNTNEYRSQSEDQEESQEKKIETTSEITGTINVTIDQIFFQRHKDKEAAEKGFEENKRKDSDFDPRDYESKSKHRFELEALEVDDGESSRNNNYNSEEYNESNLDDNNEENKEADFTCVDSEENNIVNFDVNRKVSLEEFINILPSVLGNCQKKKLKKCVPLKQLMENLDADENEWGRYAFYDEKKLYTRNLVCTDNDTYTLLLLCWTPGKESLIHDHPTDGCWMKCLTGNVIETLYYNDEEKRKLIQSKETWVRKNEVCYIDDSIGLHKVGNPCSQTKAVSLHLYSPPFQRCKVWLNDGGDDVDSDNCLQPEVCYHSIRGEKVQYHCNN